MTAKDAKKKVYLKFGEDDFAEINLGDIDLAISDLGFTIVKIVGELNNN